MSGVDTIQALVKQLASIKKKLDIFEQEKSAVQQLLIEAMVAEGMSKVTVEDDAIGERLDAQVIAAERIIINEDDLRKVIGQQKWDKVKKEVLDKELLEAAVAMGEIPAKVVADNSEVVTNKPYVKIGRKELAPKTYPKQRTRKKSAAARKVKE